MDLIQIKTHINKKLQYFTTYSWDVKSTDDLIDS
jgi:hypothetical protein